MAEKRKRMWKKMWKGSFTVEAALLMTMIIPVLVSLIYAAFYLHDGAVLQGIACEISAMGSNLAQEKDREDRLNRAKDQLVSSRLLGTGNKKISFELGENKISAAYSGTFAVPGLVMKFFNGNTLKIEKSWSRELYHPAESIRKIRGWSYLADAVKG